MNLLRQTMRAIHRIILASRSLHNAAGTLGVSTPTLKAHLAKTNYITESREAKPLSYKVMKTQWPSEDSGSQAWGDRYEACMSSTAVDLSQKTMRDIHRIILASRSLYDAAGTLGVNAPTLKAHLAKTSYITESGETKALSYEAMKTQWPSEESASYAWRDRYEVSMLSTAVDLSQKTMRYIHRIILASSSLHDAAGTLGVSALTLQAHLAKTSYRTESGETKPLSYEAMKTQWPSEENASHAWGGRYEVSMSSIAVDLSQKTMRDIHHIILASSSLKDAAGTLGVNESTLKAHLAKTSYITESEEIKPLSYEAMKTQWPSEESASQAWRDRYEACMSSTAVDLSQKTMRDIHRIILASRSLHDAAGTLGVGVLTLKIHLAKTNYITESGETKPLSYKAMKTQWPSEDSASHAWGGRYEACMSSTVVSLSQKIMRDIHRIILASSSLQDAAGTLGVSAPTLKVHLAKTSFITESGETKPLSYEAMKTQWPNEESASQAWGDRYEACMSSIAVDLSQKTMRDIHRIILASSSLKDAAGTLGVNESTLKAHLAKTSYITESGEIKALSYETMKTQWPSEESASQAWRDRYEVSMLSTVVSLSQKTMRAIHRIILASSSLKDAAGTLGVIASTLKVHLAKTSYITESGETKPLSYEAMKTQWPNEESASQAWRDRYEVSMLSTAVDLSQKTMRDIHRIILASRSLHDAAGTLGVNESTLKAHLAKTSYITESGETKPLSYEAMKTQWPSEDSASYAWRDRYDACMSSTAVDLSQKTMRDIHRIILASRSLHDAAGTLGVSAPTLKAHLAKTSYITESGETKALSYEAMKTQWPSEDSASQAWGGRYEACMSSTAVDLSQKTMRDIHRIILASSSLQDAAGTLSVSASTLKAHLAKTSYITESGEIKPLSYEAMKTQWPSEESASYAWGARYEACMSSTAVDLSQKTMRDIHRIILASSSLQDAAGTLGVNALTLKAHLAKTSYKTESGEIKSLSYEAMKTQWPSEESASHAWEGRYEACMLSATVDLSQKTMRDIHRIILASRSLHDAAGTLGVKDLTLKTHLAKTSYITESGETKPLIYEVMKTQWPSEDSAAQAWGGAYDQSISNQCSRKRKQSPVFFSNDQGSSKKSTTVMSNSPITTGFDDGDIWDPEMRSYDFVL